MDRTASHRKTALILVGFMLLLISCNLGTSDTGPPTLAPLPTLTPQATRGYADARPAVLPEIGVTPVAPSDDNMKLLDQVESDRLMSHIRSLQDLRTRHISSTQTSANEGIGAARRYINDQFEIFRAASGGRFYTFEVGFYAYATPDDERSPQYNIVGAISGTELNAGTVIVGAHYDSIGTPRDSGTALRAGRQ